MGNLMIDANVPCHNSTGPSLPSVTICKPAGRSYTKHTVLRYLLLTSLGLGLACGVTACAPKLVGPTSTSGYFFSMQVADPVIVLRAPEAATEVRVRVQDALGQLVDGVPVTFEVEPGWVQYAAVSPSQVTTRGGVARAVFTARLTGVVHVIARIDNTTAQAEITVESPPSPTSAGASLIDPQPAAAVDS